MRLNITQKTFPFRTPFIPWNFRSNGEAAWPKVGSPGIFAALFSLLLLLPPPVRSQSRPLPDSAQSMELLRMADAKMEEEDFEMASENFAAAAVGFLELGLLERYTEAISGKAVAHFYLGDYETAQETLEQGLSGLKERQNAPPQLLGELYALLGPVCDARGDYDQALAHALDAYFLLEDGLNPEGKSTYLNNIGAIYFIKNDFPQAIRYYQLAIQASREGNLPLEAAGTSVNLGLALLRTERFDSALRVLQAALPLLAAHRQDPDLRPFYLNGRINLGLALIETGQARLAIQSLEGLLAEQPGPKTAAKARANLGFALVQAGELQRGAEILAASLVQDSAYLGPEARAKVCLHLGDAQAPEAARKSYTRGIRLICEAAGLDPESLDAQAAIPHKRTLFRLFTQRALTYPTDAAATALAIGDYQNAFLLLDLLRGDLLAPASQRFFSAYATQSTEQAMQRFLASFQPGDSALLDFGYEVAERNKSLILLESIRQQQLRVQSSEVSELLQREAVLRSDRDFYQQQLYQARQDGDSARISLYEVYANDRQSELDRVLNQLKTDFPALYAPLTATDRASLADVQAYAAGKALCVVEYMYGDSLLVAFFIDGEGVRVHALRGREFAEVDAAQSVFQRLLSDWRRVLEGRPEDLETFGKAGHLLYQRLLAPGLEASERPLLIVPDGPLAQLPFEAFLESPASPGQTYLDLPYLLRRREVSYINSGMLLLRPPAEALPGEPLCLAFAPAYEGSAPPDMPKDRSLLALRGAPGTLPGAQAEVQAISSHFGGEFRIGKEARKADFMELAGQYAILHLAMHGVPNPDNANYSSLYFEADGAADSTGQLFNYEISRMRLKADLVVLSACETGLGEYVEGEGVLSLARGFLEAGARSVVMSLWKLEDAASSDLMVRFYEALAAGKTKRGALRDAKLAYLENADDLSAHPAFWAGAVLIGEEGAVPGTQGASLWWSWLLGGLGLLALLALVFIFLKKRGNN